MVEFARNTDVSLNSTKNDTNRAAKHDSTGQQKSKNQPWHEQISQRWHAGLASALACRIGHNTQALGSQQCRWTQFI